MRPSYPTGKQASKKIVAWYYGAFREGDFMDTIEAIQNRYSCRSYRADPVSSELLMQLVDAGRLAPSGRGEQPWEFVVVTDVSTLKELAKQAESGPHLGRAAACIAVFGRKDAKYVLEDCSAATENILVAAVGLGLGACWIAGDKKAYAGRVASLLNAPDTMKLISLVSIGFPADERPKDRKRRTLNEVLHWQGF
jgi:nitroreductase